MLWKSICSWFITIGVPIAMGLVLFAMWLGVSEWLPHRLATSFETLPVSVASDTAAFGNVAGVSTSTPVAPPAPHPAPPKKPVKVSSTPPAPPAATPIVPNSTLIPIPPGAGQQPPPQVTPAALPPAVPVPPPTPKPPPAPTPLPPPPAPMPPPAPAPQPPSSPPLATPSTGTLFSETFAQYEDGIITNEFANWNPNDPAARGSTNWELTSGSLFAKGGAGWTGVPDSGTAPNALSSNASGSGIFRLTSKRADFLDVRVSFDLNNHKLSTGAATPAVDWDGVHIFLRYQSQYHLYYASINRRDDTVIIKKKVPGGSSNGGTYYNLSQGGVKYAVPYGAWQKVSATIKNNPDGSVSIELFADGKLVTSARDSGLGGPPIRNAGKVGIRGDNDDFAFKNFVVTKI